DRTASAPDGGCPRAGRCSRVLGSRLETWRCYLASLARALQRATPPAARRQARRRAGRPPAAARGKEKSGGRSAHPHSPYACSRLDRARMQAGCPSLAAELLGELGAPKVALKFRSFPRIARRRRA